MSNKIQLTAKDTFNAMQNAIHIFALKEESTQVQLIKVINSEDDCKAVAMTKDGEVIGIFTDSKSAKNAINDVYNVFGDDQPFITFKIRETKKGQSVYYAEVE